MIEIIFRVTIKKNNVQWLNNNTKIHYSVERLFTRYGEYNKTLLDQEGAFVDILRVVSLSKKLWKKIFKRFFFLDVSNKIYSCS